MGDNHEEAMEQSGKESTKSRPGKLKKEPRTKPHGAIVKSRRRSTWATKEKQRANDEAVRRLQQSIRDEMAAKRAATKAAAIEQQRRREENQRKAEIVQVISNSAKLKRAKKKQLRRVEKRDTLVMPASANSA